jgi:hypothetical protein
MSFLRIMSVPLSKRCEPNQTGGHARRRNRRQAKPGNVSVPKRDKLYYAAAERLDQKNWNFFRDRAINAVQSDVLASISRREK